MVGKNPFNTTSLKTPTDGCSWCILVPNAFLSFCPQTAGNMANISYTISISSIDHCFHSSGFVVCSDEAKNLHFVTLTVGRHLGFCSISKVCWNFI